VPPSSSRARCFFVIASPLLLRHREPRRGVAIHRARAVTPPSVLAVGEQWIATSACGLLAMTVVVCIAPGAALPQGGAPTGRRSHRAALPPGGAPRGVALHLWEARLGPIIRAGAPLPQSRRGRRSHNRAEGGAPTGQWRTSIAAEAALTGRCRWLVGVVAPL